MSFLENLETRYLLPEREPNYLPLSELLGTTYENLANPPPAILVPDWKNFNSLTGGFRLREFSILCGSTGVGKTTFIANLSASLVRQSIPHFVASVETGSVDFVRRVLSVYANRDLNTGEAIPKSELFNLHKIHKENLQTKTLQLSLYENRTTVDELMSDMLHAHIHHGSKIAIIDNLNFFLEVTRAQDAIIEMDRVIHELIIFCKQVDMHVIMIMHPKKNASNARDTRVESEFEIKGSSLAVQEAHNVFLLNRPRDEDVKSGLAKEFSRELKIAKMRRYGRAVGTRIFFDGSSGVKYYEEGYAK